MAANLEDMFMFLGILEATFSEPLPPVRIYIPKVPQSSKHSQEPGNQVFNFFLLGKFHIYTEMLKSKVSCLNQETCLTYP